VALPEAIAERVEGLISERRANERRNLRRVRWWLTALAVVSRITKLREYAHKVTQYDIEFLAGDPQVGEAISAMRALAEEMDTLAEALEVEAGKRHVNDVVEDGEEPRKSIAISATNSYGPKRWNDGEAR
jgi:hypothetical protein